MICLKCRNEITDDSIFCSMCGAEVLSEETKNTKMNNGQEKEAKFNKNVLQDDKNNKRQNKITKLIIDDDIEANNKQNYKKLSKNNQVIWNTLSGIMFVISAVMIYIGYDKLTNYYSGEINSSLNKNAYVGGDAYNYIINGTHATSFFVLATMFAIIAVGFVIIGYLDKISNIKEG